MRVIERHIEVGGRSEWIVIYGIFDAHTGTVRCREDKLKQIVSEIAVNKNSYWIGGGDMAEFIIRSDPRHKESDLAPWLHGKDDIAKVQIEHLAEIVTPIAPQCLGLLCGNHEDEIFKHHERNVYSDILSAIKNSCGHNEQLGLGYDGFILLRDRRGNHHTDTLTIFTEHGYGGGRLKGGDVLNSQRIFANVDCDVYLAGHRHKAHLIPHTKVQVIEGRAREVIKLAAVAGSFRERVTEHQEDDPGSYEDRKGYLGGDMAGIKIWYHPSNHELRGEVFAY
jgi:hypothetical protein